MVGCSVVGWWDGGMVGWWAGGVVGKCPPSHHPTIPLSHYPTIPPSHHEAILLAVNFSSSDTDLLVALSSRFRITGELGRGGMGTVYLATDTALGRDVAIKVLNTEVSSGMSIERFTREIRLTARLVHPNIVPLFDSGVAASRLYYVMPHVDGEPLRARLAREGALSIAEVIRIMTDLAEALAYAHALGTVHRDIKPENIFWYRGRALLADFGVAYWAEPSDSGRMTQAGIVVGSPLYLSPEQAEGQINIDGRSDLYGLGCVAYEMLTGAPPYLGETARALLTAHLVGEIPSARARRPEVPPVLDALVSRLMAKEPDDRPRTGTELLEELRVLSAANLTPTIPGSLAAVRRTPQPDPAAALPPEAAELLKRARQLFQTAIQGGPGAREKLSMAQVYAERALQHAPDSAVLLVLLSDVHHVAGVRGLVPNPEEAVAKARELRYQALALDDSLGTIHSSLGVDLLYWEDEFELAGAELARGVELSPDGAEGRRYYGSWLKIAGRAEEALGQMRAAARLAPAAPFMRVGEADVLMTLGRYDEAVGALREALRLQPRYEAALERLEMACHRAGRHEEALDARRALLGARGATARMTALEQRTAELGWVAAREADLRAELATLLERAETEDPFLDRDTSRQLSDQIIILLAELGEWSEAMTWVERGYHRRPGRLRRVLRDLPYDYHGLAVDPRFARLLRLAGLSELMDQ